MTSPDLIESVARAIWDAGEPYPSRMMDEHVDAFRAKARAAIEAVLREAALIADGYAKHAWEAQPSAQEAAVAAEHIAAAIRSRLTQKDSG